MGNIRRGDLVARHCAPAGPIAGAADNFFLSPADFFLARFVVLGSNEYSSVDQFVGRYKGQARQTDGFRKPSDAAIADPHASS